MSEYFQEPKSLEGRVKNELDLPNYATKADLKNVPTNLRNLKIKLDRLDVDKLVSVPVDLSKLSDVVKNVVKKDVYNAKMKNIEDKMPYITNLATKITPHAKINEAKGEIFSIVN